MQWVVLMLIRSVTSLAKFGLNMERVAKLSRKTGGIWLIQMFKLFFLTLKWMGSQNYNKLPQNKGTQHIFVNGQN